MSPTRLTDTQNTRLYTLTPGAQEHGYCGGSLSVKVGLPETSLTRAHRWTHRPSRETETTHGQPCAPEVQSRGSSGLRLYRPAAACRAGDASGTPATGAGRLHARQGRLQHRTRGLHTRQGRPRPARDASTPARDAM